MSKKKNKKKNLLHKTERDILVLLNKTNVPLSYNRIADKLEISYMTIKKYVDKLVEKNILTKVKGSK